MWPCWFVASARRAVPPSFNASALRRPSQLREATPSEATRWRRSPRDCSAPRSGPPRSSRRRCDAPLRNPPAGRASRRPWLAASLAIRRSRRTMTPCAAIRCRHGSSPGSDWRHATVGWCERPRSRSRAMSAARRCCPLRPACHGETASAPSGSGCWPAPEPEAPRPATPCSRSGSTSSSAPEEPLTQPRRRPRTAVSRCGLSASFAMSPTGHIFPWRSAGPADRSTTSCSARPPLLMAGLAKCSRPETWGNGPRPMLSRASCASTPSRATRGMSHGLSTTTASVRACLRTGSTLMIGSGTPGATMCLSRCRWPRTVPCTTRKPRTGPRPPQGSG